MSRLTFTLACGLVVVFLVSTHHAAVAKDSGAKNCRMEQQCHWENFKKICVWVKVCR